MTDAYNAFEAHKNLFGFKTPIDHVILGRMSNPIFRLLDSTLATFEQTPTVFSRRVTADKAGRADTYEYLELPEDVLRVINRISSGISDPVTKAELLRLVPTYETFNPEYVFGRFAKAHPPANYRRSPSILELLLLLIQDYTRSTIFRFSVARDPAGTIPHIDTLDKQIDKLDFIYKHTRNQLRLEIDRQQGSQRVFDHGRSLFWGWYQEEFIQHDYIFRMRADTRPDWSHITMDGPRSLAIWKLYSETMPVVTEETLLAVKQSDFSILMDVSEVDLAYEAIRQALILFYNQDPTPRMKSQDMVLA